MQIYIIMTKQLLNIILIGAGSCIGGICRYLISMLIHNLRPTQFPWSTFAINILGCFIIGLIYGLIDKGVRIPDSLRLFLTVGFCGGFTTFSTFMNENYLLFTGNGHLLALLYAIFSITAGFIAVYSGYLLTRI